MLIGVAFALAAGMLWGLVFVGPLLIPEYPAMLQSFGRYLAFGLIALPLGWFDRAELRRLSRSDWIEALKFAAIGNVLYYMLLSAAIQRSGAPMPSMILGLLPVVIPVCANFLYHERDGRLPWLKLIPAMVVMLVGLICVNHVEITSLYADPDKDYVRYSIGIALAVVSLACWTWYPMRNSKWLREHPDRNPRAWATAQGLATLPLAVIGYLLFWGWAAATNYDFAMPFGPRPLVFIGLMIVIGLFASWVGTLCWNEASQRLSTAMVGQFIVFETLAALTYAYLLRGEWPEPMTLLGIGLLMGGMLWAVRIKPIRSEMPH
jgi:drug/metabolite transporter (DMT)-like permease